MPLEGDCVAGCGAALVNSAEEEGFRSEMQAEISRCRGGSACADSGTCPSGATADCVGGLCAWGYRHDAGL